MQRKICGTSALTHFVLVVALCAAWQAHAQDAETPYPNMAPLDQYLMERDAQIALARSAAVESISREAEVKVLGRHGCETVVKGKNEKELPALGSGAMCYMMSKQSYLSDRDGHWHPHLIFSVLLMDPAAWGGRRIDGIPVILRVEDTPDRMTVFWIPVAKVVGRYGCTLRRG